MDEAEVSGAHGPESTEVSNVLRIAPESPDLNVPPVAPWDIWKLTPEQYAEAQRILDDFADAMKALARSGAINEQIIDEWDPRLTVDQHLAIAQAVEHYNRRSKP